MQDLISINKKIKNFFFLLPKTKQKNFVFLSFFSSQLKKRNFSLEIASENLKLVMVQIGKKQFPKKHRIQFPTLLNIQLPYSPLPLQLSYSNSHTSFYDSRKLSAWPGPKLIIWDTYSTSNYHGLVPGEQLIRFYPWRDYIPTYSM